MNLAWNLGHTFMLSDFSLPIVSDCIIMKQMGGVEKCRIVNASPPLYHADVGKLKDMNFLVNFPKFKFPRRGFVITITKPSPQSEHRRIPFRFDPLGNLNL